ncbi:MAG: hypothetical protein A2X36_06790 [Elusimicrobia bacterium GWA2_69_24]|nr:MAG: hypothetical protein A2X36_06790 [Elusimicrobia bacterium GWA2_69_24]HBL17183.1 hypothetical protein [Elusimicrobiota bacterium]
MIEYAKLELRKNRVLFIGMALTFLGSIPFAAAMTALNRQGALAGFNAVLLFWTILGLPLIAILFGASSGAGLRAETAQEAESPLPVSPRCRAGGAVAACLAHVLLLGMLILLTSAVISPAWRETLFSGALASTFVRAFFTLTLFTLATLLLSSFIAAYAIGQGIVGGVLGALIGGTAAGALSLGLGLQAVFEVRAAFTTLALFSMAVSLPAGLFALDRLAAWVERRPKRGWREGFLIALATTLGSLAACAAFAHAYHRLTRSLTIAAAGDAFYPWISTRNDDVLFPGARRVSRKGVLLHSFEGGLIWMTPEGDRAPLIPARPRSFTELLGYLYFWDRIESVLWDADGGLWVLVAPDQADPVHQLWHGWIGRPFSLHSRLEGRRPYQLVRRGSELGMLAWGDATEDGSYAPIPPRGARPRWVTLGMKRSDFLLRGWEEAGLAARLSADGRTLTRRTPDGRTRRWTLPGKGPAAAVVKPTALGGQTLFALQLRLKDGGYALALCRPDGTVTTHWPSADGASYWLETAPDGSAWGWRNGLTLHLAAPDGALLPPLDLEPIARAALGEKTRLERWGNRLLRREAFGAGRTLTRWGTGAVRIEGTRAWLVLNHRLLVVVDAATGKLLSRWELPAYSDARRYSDTTFHIAESGFFLHTGRRLYFIDWAGTRRDLGAA